MVTRVNESGNAKRTLKYLLAIVAGKWVVNDEWVRMCAEQECTPDESDFVPKGDQKCVTIPPILPKRIRVSNHE